MNKIETDKILDAIPDMESNYESMELAELAESLANTKANLELLGSLKTSIQKTYDRLSIDIIPDKMDEAKVSTMKVIGVGRLQTKSDIRCHTPSDRSDDLKRWLTENGHAALIAETVNASTLKALIKEMMRENRAWPETIVNVTPYTRATVVKA